MSFAAICEVFGGSIFPEELRGNYPQSSVNWDELKSWDDFDDPATISLLNAVHATLIGHHGSAYETLKTLRTEADHGNFEQEWRLRACSYIITPWATPFIRLWLQVYRLSRCTLNSPGVI